MFSQVRQGVRRLPANRVVQTVPGGGAGKGQPRRKQLPGEEEEESSGQPRELEQETQH